MLTVDACRHLAPEVPLRLVERTARLIIKVDNVGSALGFGLQRSPGIVDRDLVDLRDALRLAVKVRSGFSLCVIGDLRLLAADAIGASCRFLRLGLALALAGLDLALFLFLFLLISFYFSCFLF